MPRGKPIKLQHQHSLEEATIGERVQLARPKKVKKVVGSQFSVERGDDGSIHSVPASLRKKIVSAAREQEWEIMRETKSRDEDTSFRVELQENAEPDDEDYDEEVLDSGDDDEEFEEDMQIAADDQATLDAFFGDDAPSGPTARGLDLAQLILQTIEEADGEIEDDNDLPERVVSAYRMLGAVLARYRSGKLPRAFRVLPKIKQWTAVLDLTDPFSWTPHSYYVMTRSMVHSAKESRVLVWFRDYLLPACRREIAREKKLSYHLYQALRRACYRPGAFLQGIVCSLLENDCSLREALIIGSVVRRTSLPVYHTCALMMRLTEMDWSPPLAYMLEILIRKKYALPTSAVDVMVDYFYSFRHLDSRLPVVWHRSVLAFVEHYKSSLTAPQRKMLFKLKKEQSHPLIDAQLRRELYAAHREAQAEAEHIDQGEDSDEESEGAYQDNGMEDA